jgi:hypothetical protein
MTAGGPMSWSRALSCAAALLFVPGLAAEPIRVWAANPRYFERDRRPVVFVTSDHHYGAVIDADFDYVRFLDTLAASGMNLTRIYPGAMFEATDKYVSPGHARGTPARTRRWRSPVTPPTSTISTAGIPRTSRVCATSSSRPRGAASWWRWPSSTACTPTAGR